MNPALEKAISLAGSQVALAKAIGKRQAHIWSWMNKHPVSPEAVIPICKAVAWGVTPHEMRPDLYPNPTDGMPVDEAG